VNRIARKVIHSRTHNGTICGCLRQHRHVADIAIDSHARPCVECPLYDNNQSSLEAIALIDAARLTSNSLSTTMQRPAGAP
jgi:hypothetical protein